MIIRHYDLEVALPDSWWIEAEMVGFVPKSRAFRPNLRAAQGLAVFEAKIDAVAPLKRAPGVGVFNDNEEATAKERVVRILRGFREEAELPPIHLVKLGHETKFRYKIGNGSHRFYCSLAVGFTHVPAFEGFDFDADYI